MGEVMVDIADVEREARNPFEPWYDADDCGCSCNDSGIESEWEWDLEQDCYICTGCGEVQ